MTALGFAVRAPDRLTTLVAVGMHDSARAAGQASALRPTDPAREFVATIRPGPPRWTATIDRIQGPGLLGAPAPRDRRRHRPSSRCSSPAELRSIAAPTLIDPPATAIRWCRSGTGGSSVAAGPPRLALRRPGLRP